MIAGKINKIKKAAKQLWKNEGDSLNYFTCLGVIGELEKLDKGKDFAPVYINYPMSIYNGDTKKIGDYYINYYCR